MVGDVKDTILERIALHVHQFVFSMKKTWRATFVVLLFVLLLKVEMRLSSFL